MENDKATYLRKKGTAKLVAFYESLEEFLSLYIEIKRDHPEIAKKLLERHEFLMTLEGEGKKLWDDYDNDT